jgi:2-dehydro-3-deoxyphosphogluconate aldolase/(4S)-4-hydroxy-2-oxoglutarate aldolase
LKGPFSDTDYVTVGGVNIQNAAEFIKRGFIGVGIGNSLVPAGLIKNNDWAGVTNHVSNIFNIING